MRCFPIYIFANCLRFPMFLTCGHMENTVGDHRARGNYSNNHHHHRDSDGDDGDNDDDDDDDDDDDNDDDDVDDDDDDHQYLHRQHIAINHSPSGRVLLESYYFSKTVISIRPCVGRFWAPEQKNNRVPHNQISILTNVRLNPMAMTQTCEHFGNTWQFLFCSLARRPTLRRSKNYKSSKIIKKTAKIMSYQKKRSNPLRKININH